MVAPGWSCTNRAVRLRLLYYEGPGVQEETYVPQLMRTANPALNDQTFRREGVALGDAMTLEGTVNKTGVLLICVIATAAWTWNLFLHSHSPGSLGGVCTAYQLFSTHRTLGH